MMERLTIKGFNFTSDFVKQVCNHGVIAQALKKLQEYEDLEEQGKLLKLPCAVGDTVYVIPSEVNYRLNIANIANGMKKHNRVYEQPVSRIEFFPGGYVLSTCDGIDSVSDRFFNITWFLTKKEAEEALKKMERDVDERRNKA